MRHTVRIENFIPFNRNGVGLRQRNNGTEANRKKQAKVN